MPVISVLNEENKCCLNKCHFDSCLFIIKEGPGVTAEILMILSLRGGGALADRIVEKCLFVHFLS